MLKLSANPTFTVKNIDIPTTDGSFRIHVTFKYKTAKEWNAYVAEHFKPDAKTTDIIFDLIDSWEEVEAPFSKEVLETLGNVHVAAPNAILHAYTDGLNYGRLGN